MDKEDFKKCKKETPEKLSEYGLLGMEIGRIVNLKRHAYGDSFGKSGEILSILYPDGIKPPQYNDLLCVTRIIDKLFRICTDRDALGESPYFDIAGYALLGHNKSMGSRHIGS